MECPFHAGSEAITTCVQCETPICPLCASESKQVLLCLNCYRARVDEIAAGLGSASARLAKERRKGEEKAAVARKRKGKEPLLPPPAAKAAYATEATGPLWDREDIEGLGPEEAAAHAPAQAAEAPLPEPAPMGKKEQARLRKEEAKRLKREEREMARAVAAEVAEAPLPEPAPFFDPVPEPIAYAPPPEAAAPPVEAPPLEVELPVAPPFEEEPPYMPPAPPQMPPSGYPGEPSGGGVRLPRLEDLGERLEPLPPREGRGEHGLPPGLEPPEGFFD